MVLLLGLIVLILLVGSAAMMNAFGIIIALIGMVGVLVWISVKTGLDAGLLMLMGGGGLVALLGLLYLAAQWQRRKGEREAELEINDWKKRTEELQAKADESQVRAAQYAAYDEIARKIRADLDR